MLVQSVLVIHPAAKPMDPHRLINHARHLSFPTACDTRGDPGRPFEAFRGYNSFLR